MTLEKIKSFVYYGAQNYISLESLKIMVPACYLFLTYISFVAAIAGNVIPWAIAMLSVVILYSAVVYTFHIWCPKPSYACRFATSAFSMISLSVIFQLFVYTILFAGKYISFIDIGIIMVLQIISVIVYISMQKAKIKEGEYLNKKVNSAGSNTVIVGGASLGYFFAKMFLRDVDDHVAANIVISISTALSVLLGVLATLHLMKYYYAKKCQITSDENGENFSLQLIPQKKEERSLLKKILFNVWKIFVLVLLIAVLIGVYQVSR